MPFSDKICNEILNWYLGKLTMTEVEDPMSKSKYYSKTIPLTQNGKLYLALLTNNPEERQADGSFKFEELAEYIDNPEDPTDPIKTGYSRVWLSDKAATDEEWPMFMTSAGAEPTAEMKQKEDYDETDLTWKRGMYNKNEIHFDKAMVAWTDVGLSSPIPDSANVIRGFAIYNTKEVGTGEPIYFSKLDNPITVDVEQVPMFERGTLKIGFADDDLSKSEVSNA